jgi:hypothetical protein
VNSSGTSSCETADSFEDCQKIHVDYIYNNKGIGDPCKINQNTLPGDQVITESQKGPTDITISVQTVWGISR